MLDRRLSLSVLLALFACSSSGGSAGGSSGGSATSSAGTSTTTTVSTSAGSNTTAATTTTTASTTASATSSASSGPATTAGTGNGSTTTGASPAPVVGVTWDCNTLVTAADGSDLWPITWSDDGNQYAAWGDGNGFESARFGYGFSRIAGPADSLTGTDLGTFSPGGDGGKIAGIISIGGVLYMARNDQNGTAVPHHSIIRSTDHGSTIEDTGVGFPVSAAPNMCVGPIVNFGQDNADAIDEYVYFIAGDWGAPNPVYLVRAPSNALDQQGQYEVFSGTPDAPAWDSDFGSRQPVFSDASASSGNGSLKTVIVYDPPLQQFLLTFPSADDLGIWKMYAGPNVYGPWTEIGSYDNWCSYAGQATAEMLMRFVAPGWISDDGLTLWMVFSGTGNWDRFNAVRGTLQQM